MGAVFQLLVGDVEVVSGKNWLPSEVMLPFQSSDLHQKVMDNHPTLHVYRTVAGTVARRLDLLGYSMARARRTYAEGIRLLDEAQRARWPDHLAGREGFERWCESILSDARDAQERRAEDPLEDHPPHWEYTLLGFPDADLGVVLRALVEQLPAGTPVTLDLTDLVVGGYLTDDKEVSFVEEREPLIILTEGKSDSRVLGEALRTLHPEFAEFVRFIDYETANPAGGTDQLVQFVKMFVGCGIGNRIVVLLDNDAAGHQALGALRGLKLPETVRVTCLPSLPWFDSYPTEGPDGRAHSSIDGRACSLELYLGQQALADEGGLQRPVRWGGYNDKVGRYQGHVVGKADVLERFESALADVRSGKVARRTLDLAGIEAIFERIVEVVTEDPIPTRVVEG